MGCYDADTSAGKGEGRFVAALMILSSRGASEGSEQRKTYTLVGCKGQDGNRETSKPHPACPLKLSDPSSG
jgi:hypothetical protein